MNLRSIFCQLFKCAAFTALVDGVKSLLGSATDLLSRITGIETSLESIEAKIQEIMEKQFPTAELQAISLMLGLLLKPPMSIWLDVPKGAQDETIDVAISIKGDPLQEIAAWGLDLHFDPNSFAFVGVAKGKLCETWSTVDGNEVEAGLIRCGGYAGNGKSIIGESIGSIALIKLKVLASEGETEISVDSYVDGIQGFTPMPAAGIFFFKE